MAWWMCKLCDAGEASVDNSARARAAARRHYLNEHYYGSLQTTRAERHASFSRQLRLTQRGERAAIALAALFGATAGFLSGVVGYGVPA